MGGGDHFSSFPIFLSSATQLVLSPRGGPSFFAYRHAIFSFTLTEAFVASSFDLVAGNHLAAGSVDSVGPSARFQMIGAFDGTGAGGGALDLNPSEQYLLVGQHGPGSSSEVVRLVDLATRRVTTIAGQEGSFGHSDGTGTTATFNRIVGVGFHRSGQYALVAEQSTVRKLTSSPDGTWTVSTLASSCLNPVIGPLYSAAAPSLAYFIMGEGLHSINLLTQERTLEVGGSWRNAGGVGLDAAFTFEGQAPSGSTMSPDGRYIFTSAQGMLQPENVTRISVMVIDLLKRSSHEVIRWESSACTDGLVSLSALAMTRNNALLVADPSCGLNSIAWLPAPPAMSPTPPLFTLLPPPPPDDPPPPEPPSNVSSPPLDEMSATTASQTAQLEEQVSTYVCCLI